MRFFAIASILFTAAVSVLANPVSGRQTPQSAAAILADLSNTVTPLAYQLLYATPENATEENLTPIIGNINTAVTNSATNLKALSGQPLSVILASADGSSILSASDLAGILSDIVNLVFQALGSILQVVDSALYTIIFDLACTLGEVLCDLISILCTLVTELVGLLVSLLAPVLSIVDSLGLGSLLGGLLGGLL